MSGGFVLGEVLGLTDRWDVTAALTVMLAVLTAVLFLRRKKTGRSWMIWLLPVCVLVGFLRAQNVRRACEHELFLALDGKEAAVEGTVASVRERRQGGWSFDLTECVVYAGKQKTDVHSLMGMVIYLDAENRPMLGSRVCAEGNVEAVDTARNPGEFDYRMYYRAQKKNYRMFADCFYEVGGDFSRYREFLYSVSVKAGEILDRVSYGFDAGIYRAALLGDKTELDEEVYGLYQKNGISHLLAISGLHLSMFSAAVYGAVRKMGLGYGKAGILGGAFLCSYAVMTGASPSVVRALIMALFGYGAACFGRTSDLLTALGAAAVVILWDSPYQITQAGVQLSFGAILGIGAAAPCLAEGLKRWNTGIREVVSVSLGVQLMTAPVILYHFFQVPVYGMLVNLAAVPLMGIVLASGTAGILLGSVNGAAGRFAMGSGHAVLRLYEAICRICGRLPGNTFVAGRPEVWRIAVYYLCLLILLLMLRISDKEGAGRCRELFGRCRELFGRCRELFGRCRELFGWCGELFSWCGKPPGRYGESFGRCVGPLGFCRKLLCLCALAGMTVVFWAEPVKGLRAAFLDVGQGDGIVLCTGGNVILIDGGSSDEKSLGKNRLEPYLKSIGEPVIDLAVVTHGDMDHISGLKYLLEETGDIAVKCLALPSLGRGQEVYENLRTAAEEKGASVVWMKRGDVLEAGELRMTCLYPKDSDDTKYLYSEKKRENGYVAAYGQTEREKDDAAVYGQTEREKDDAAVYGQMEREKGNAAVYGQMEREDDTAAYGQTGSREEDRNEHSLVLKADYGDFHMLLTGDMSSQGEEKIMEDAWAADFLEDTQVLKIAHHGSKYSTGEAWIDRIKPRWAVVSYGEGNRYGHPHAEVMGRLRNQGTAVYETGKVGAVILNTDGRTIIWSTWLKEK